MAETKKAKLRAKRAAPRKKTDAAGPVSTIPTPSRSKPIRPGKAETARLPKRGRSQSDSVQAGRLRIKVRAYEHGILDKSVKQIIDTAARYNAKVIGPVPLPIDIRKYTVNRAAFIDKDSREQFEMRIHKRMIDILNPEPKVIEALTNIDLPSGVSIDVKMM